MIYCILVPYGQYQFVLAPSKKDAIQKRFHGLEPPDFKIVKGKENTMLCAHCHKTSYHSMAKFQGYILCQCVNCLRRTDLNWDNLKIIHETFSKENQP